MSAPFGGWPPPTPAPVTSVFGRIGAVIATLGDYAASLISNDSSVPGATVKDALNNLLGGGGAPVLTVFGRIGNIVATSGDYTSTLVTNLSSVTGTSVTAALNALNTTIAALTASVGALNSTSIANVSSVAGAKVTDALNTLLALIPGGGAANRDPVWDPPTVGSPDDDEFTTDTLASGVWKIYADTRPVTTPFVRDGAIDVTVTPAAGHFRSSVIGGTLYLQLATAQSVLVTKPVAGAITTKQIWWVAVNQMNDANVAASSASLQFMLWLGAAGPIPDNENRMRTGYQPEAVVLATRVGGAAVTNTSNTWLNVQTVVQGVGSLVNHNVAAAGNVQGFVFTRAGDMALTPAGQASAYNLSTCWCGFLLANSSPQINFGAGGVLYGLQFFRRREIVGVCTGLTQA